MAVNVSVGEQVGVKVGVVVRVTVEVTVIVGGTGETVHTKSQKEGRFAAALAQAVKDKAITRYKRMLR